MHGKFPFCKTLHLEEEVQSNKYGHRIVGMTQDEINLLSDDKGPGAKIEFQEEQNGQFWNYVQGSLKLLSTPTPTSYDKAPPKQRDLKMSNDDYWRAKFEHEVGDIKRRAYHCHESTAIELVKHATPPGGSNFTEMAEQVVRITEFLQNARKHHMGAK